MKKKKGNEQRVRVREVRTPVVLSAILIISSMAMLSILGNATGITWDNPHITVSNAGVDAYDPSITAIGNDIFMVWTEEDELGNEEVWFSYNYDDGRNLGAMPTMWSVPVRISAGDDPQCDKSRDPDICVSAGALGGGLQGDVLHVVWEARDSITGDWGIWYAYSLDRGITWTDWFGGGVLGWVSPDPAVSGVWCINPADASPDNADTVQIVWEEQRPNGTMEIYHTYVDLALGVQGGIVVVSIPDRNGDQDPDVACYGLYAHVVWEGSSPSTIRYRRSPNPPAGVWDPEVTLSANPAESEAYDPAIASEGEYVHVVWADNRLGQSEIYYRRHYDKGDPLIAWPPEKRISPNDNEDSEEPAIAVDIDVHVAFVDYWVNPNNIHYTNTSDYGYSWIPDTAILPATPGGCARIQPCIASTMGGVHLGYTEVTFGPPVTRNVKYTGSHEYIEWHNYKHDGRSTGFTNTMGPSALGVMLSGADPAFPNAVFDEGQPLIEGDRVYVSFFDNSVAPPVGGIMAFNKQTMVWQWTWTNGIAIADGLPYWCGGIHHTPAINDQVMYFGDDRGQLFSLTLPPAPPPPPPPPTLNWVFAPGPANAFGMASPTLYNPIGGIPGQGLIYIGGPDGVFRCIDYNNPAGPVIFWQYAVPNQVPIESTAAVVDNNAPNLPALLPPIGGAQPRQTHRVVFADTAGFVHCMDADPGDAAGPVVDEGFNPDGGAGAFDIVWRFGTGEAIGSQSPVIIHNRVYIGTNEHTFYCLDMEGNVQNDGTDDGINDGLLPPGTTITGSDVFWFQTYDEDVRWGEAVVQHGKVFVGCIFDDGCGGNPTMIMHCFDEYGFEDLLNDMWAGELPGASADILWMNTYAADRNNLEDLRSPVLADQMLYFTFSGSVYIVEEYTGVAIAGIVYNANPNYKYNPSVCVHDDWNDVLTPAVYIPNLNNLEKRN